jgi:hypothetical protein
MKQFPVRWNALIVLLALASMLGCQGLSSGSSGSKGTVAPSAGQLTVTPASVSFGLVEVGNNQNSVATLTNTGGSSLTVTQAPVTGAGYSVSGLSLPLILAAGKSQPITVTFTPQSAGTINGNLAIANTGSTPTVNVALSGTGQTAGALTANPASLNFGSVQVGNNQTLPETLINSGGSSVIITQANPGTGFSVSGLNLPLTLPAGKSQPFSVTFTPTSVGSNNGNLAIISNASNSTLNLSLSGNGLAQGALTPSPSSLSFGNVQVGNDQQLSETLTNSGGVNVTISNAAAAGTGFSMSGLNPPLVITPGAHYTFTVTFTPPSSGNDAGSVSIVSDASNPNLSIPTTGTGTPAALGQLAVTPTNIDFGNVAVGTNSQQTGTLTASGANVTVSSAPVTGSAFGLSGFSSFPVVIPAGQHVQFTVTFSPAATGGASGNISFASDASNSPTIESLTGNGIPAPQHSVSLSWTASSSQGVIGYNIYRGTIPGGPYSKINSVLDASTIYSDTTVVDGTTYYYATTAVNSSNEESVYSNQATAVIPPP